jgi:hypothetical protein
VGAWTPPPRISMFKLSSSLYLKKNASAVPSLGSPGDYTQREGQLQASKMGGDIREPKLVVPCACLFGTSRPLAWHRRTRRPFRSAPLADQRHVRQRPEHRGCCFLLAKLGRKLQGRVSFIDSLAQVGVRG